tara:strand:+ start:752 stop:1822 length:1071 start_codon:yes stop_codon:yes gene_type:complete
MRIGINGFGRIGRLVFRSILEKRRNIDVVAINNLSNVDTSCFLLKYDTIHGAINKNNVIYNNNDTLVVNGHYINMTHNKNIENIDWDKNEVEIVVECTGKFNNFNDCSKHLEKNNVNKVILSAPGENINSIIYGINHNKIIDNNIISASSCTTNCLAPIVKIIDDKFYLEKGFMTTIHSYTTDQRILDNSHKDLRRARCATNSIIPTKTGANKSIGEIFPHLNNKIDGISIRVPTQNVSMIEFVFNTNKTISVDNINEEIIYYSKNKFKNILDYTYEPLVSSDFNHNPHSCIVDLSLTKVLDNNMGKITAWYDNEWAFANRICDIIENIQNNGVISDIIFEDKPYHFYNGPAFDEI